MFDRICLEAVRDNFFFQVSGVSSVNRETRFFGGGDVQQNRQFQTFWLAGRTPSFPLLVRHSDPLIKETLRRVLDLHTVMILKTVSESIFF